VILAFESGRKKSRERSFAYQTGSEKNIRKVIIKAVKNPIKLPYNPVRI
jgi:hypothetical protein